MRFRPPTYYPGMNIQITVLWKMWFRCIALLKLCRPPMFPPPGFGCNYGYQYYLQRILQCSVIVRKYCVLCIKIVVGIRASPSIIMPSPPIIQPPYMKLCFQLHQFWYQLWMLCQRMTPPAYVPGMHYQWIQLQYMWRICIQLCLSLRPPSCSSGSSWILTIKIYFMRLHQLSIICQQYLMFRWRFIMGVRVVVPALPGPVIPGHGNCTWQWQWLLQLWYKIWIQCMRFRPPTY